MEIPLEWKRLARVSIRPSPLVPALVHVVGGPTRVQVASVGSTPIGPALDLHLLPASLLSPSASMCRSLKPDASSLAGPSRISSARSGGGGATLPSDRRSGGSSLLANVRWPPRSSCSSSAHDCALHGGLYCCPPLQAAVISP